MHDNLDPIDAFLSLNVSAADAANLKQDLLLKTTKALRRRRHWQQLGLAAALAACFSAGILSGNWDRMFKALPDNQPIAQPVPPPEQGIPRSIPALPPAAKVVPRAEVPALVMEWQALDSGGQRTELFRQAGDRYLENDGDVESALRCYRSTMETATEEDLTISPDDNWLLMALKEARQKEKSHANDDS